MEEPETKTPVAEELVGEPAGVEDAHMVAGDNLWRIATSQYDDTGTKWEHIYGANTDIIQALDMICIDQILVNPAA